MTVVHLPLYTPLFFSTFIKQSIERTHQPSIRHGYVSVESKMPQNEYVPQGFSLESSSHDPLYLQLKSGGERPTQFTLACPSEGTYRLTFTSESHPLPPWPSTQRKNDDDSKGQNVVSKSSGGKQNGTTMTTWSIRSSSGDTIVDVDWATGPPVIAIRSRDVPDEPIYQDLPHRSYILDGSGIGHYTRYKRGTLHIGLGEKAAPLDLSNRHFNLSATDCFGYDAYRTDPLYKHIPLLINATPEFCVGTFSTSYSRGSYAVGSEIDGLWGHYKVYRQDFGGLEEYIIVGKTIKEVVRKYADVVGYPLLVPRWAFGYLAGGMKYSMLDEPRACDALMGFADKLKEHDIPCSGFQLSSGYTVAGTEPRTRNVFTWNMHRFPDPKGFIAAYHSRGIRLIANVKPYILSSHPEYERLKAGGAFFTDPQTKESATARLWSAGGGESGVGGHIDFTSKIGYDFWYEGVKALKSVGIDCIWNDNNEYTISDDQWQCALEITNPSAVKTAIRSKDVGLWGRYLHTELMGKASHDAAVDAEPNQRPFVLTRSATAGTMRYCASSWSGDNVTSWESMKGANALSLTAGVCLLQVITAHSRLMLTQELTNEQCYGHDIGGFEGPQPSPELLVRWIQLGIYSPRFAINCFKTSPENNSVGDVIEPWMYPEVTPIIRQAIRRRYEMIPYLYSLALNSHLHAEPPQRWTGWGYESDPEVWRSKILKDGETQYFLGDALLIGGVYEPGETKAKMYLPTVEGGGEQQFLNLNSPYQYLDAGKWVEIDSEWSTSIPVLARVGSLMPVGKPVQTLSPGEKSNPANLPVDDYRAVELFPPKGRSIKGGYRNHWYEDDGISPAPSGTLKTEIVYTCDENVVDITEFTQCMVGVGIAQFVPLWKQLHFTLPIGDKRLVTFKGQETKSMENHGEARMLFTTSVSSLSDA